MMTVITIAKFILLVAPLLLYKTGKVFEFISLSMLICFSLFWLYDSLVAKQSVEVIASIILEIVLIHLLCEKIKKQKNEKLSDFDYTMNQYDYEHLNYDNQFLDREYTRRK